MALGSIERYTTKKYTPHRIIESVKSENFINRHRNYIAPVIFSPKKLINQIRIDQIFSAIRIICIAHGYTMVLTFNDLDEIHTA